MERLQIWLGLRPRETGLQILPSVTDNVDRQGSGKSAHTQLTSTDAIPLQPHQPIPARPRGDNSMASLVPVTDVSGAVSAEKPQEKKGCIQCRMITASVGLGGAVYMMYQGITNRQRYTGYKRVAFVGHCVSLATGLLLMCVCVTFEVGPCKPNQEGEKHTLKSLLQDDVQMFKDKLSWLSSSSPPSEGTD